MGDKPIWEQIGSSFIQHYYQLFDNDRTQLGAIYVSLQLWDQNGTLGDKFGVGPLHPVHTFWQPSLNLVASFYLSCPWDRGLEVWPSWLIHTFPSVMFYKSSSVFWDGHP